MTFRWLEAFFIHITLICGLALSPVVPALAFVTTDISVRSKPFKIGNENFEVIQDQDFRGRVTREMIVSPSYTEFVSDPQGTGQHEIWELSAPARGLSVRARNPIAGKYSILEIEKKRRGGTLLMTFTFMPKRNLYELTATRFTREHRQLAQSLVLDTKDSNGRYVPACVDPTAVQASATEWLNIVQKLSANGVDAAQQKLQCYLRRYQNAVFGPNCMGSDFASGMDQMRAGMIDVLLSAKKGVPADRYMQCLSDNGFSTHETRMEAGFANLEEQLKAVADSDPEMAAALKNPAAMAALCTKPSSITKLIGRSTPPVDCQLSAADSEAAEYIGGQTDQVIFHVSPAQIASNAGIASEFKSKPPTSSESSNLTRNVYGSYFFHELLHKSQIEDETVVYGLQNCCDGRPGDHSGDCRKAQKIAGDQTLADRYNTTFEQSISGYNNLEAQIEKGYGTDGAKAMMHSYFNGFDAHKENAQRSYNQCVQATPTCDQTCKDKCASGYVDDMAKFSKDFFNDPKYCAPYYKKAQDSTAITCSQISEQLSTLFASAGSTSKPGQAEAAHEAIENNAGNPNLFKTNGVILGDSSVAAISQKANGTTTPTSSAVKNAVTSSANSPSTLRMGDTRAAIERYNGGTPILNAADTMARRVGNSILPSAYADSGSSESASVPSSRSSYRSNSPSASITNEFGGSPNITASLSPTLTPSLGGVAGLRSNAGGPVAAAQSVGARAAPATSGDAGSAAADDAGAVAPSKAASRESGGVRPLPDRTTLRGTGRALASTDDPVVKAPGSNSRDDKQAARSNFSSLPSATFRKLITGPYPAAHELLTGSRSTEFNASLIDRGIKITDQDGASYGPMRGREIYTYCKSSGRFALPGACQ